ncbi:MAG: HAMP domain-containing methyl-accepting chemotaxis protein [Methylococcaceae bacterium]
MNNLTIKLKLYGLAGLVIVCLAILSVIALTSFSSIKNLNKTLLIVEVSKSNMLTLRRNEKDFLARLDIKYQQKFKNNFDILMNDINQVKNNIETIELEQEKKLSNLVKYLQTYHVSFNKIVTLHQKIGFDHNSGLRGKLRTAVHNAEKRLKQSNSIQLTADMLMLRRNEKDFMLRRLSKYIDKFDHNYAIFNQHLKESTLSDSTKTDIASNMTSYRSTLMNLSQGYNQLGLTPKEGLQGEMRSTVHKTEDIFSTLTNNLSSIITSQSNNIYTKLLLITGVMLVLIVGSVLFIAHSISIRLDYLQTYFNNLALKPGDLSVLLQVSGKDEVASINEIFNQFIANFKMTFSQIPIYSDNLEKESSLNNSVSEQTHQLATSQQKESSEIAESVQQMVSATEEITRNIHIAAGSAEEADEAVLKGKQVIQDVSLSINSLANKLQTSAEVTKKLEENSNNISTVLDVIRGIAEQTNLLALNAAIEAARAGEQGRGFAVVADEVRTLAGRTQDSTTQIQALIESLQKNVKTTVNVMQEGSTGASSTAESASNATQVLDEISSSVSHIFELNASIATASEEQNAISNNISKSILSINEMAKETANQSNRARQSSTEMNSIASELQSLVGTYKF